MCCGRADGTPREAGSALGFFIVGPDGEQIGQPWWNHFEARAHAESMGAGFRVVSQVVVLQD